MSQRFTVELERTLIYRAAVEVEADDLSNAVWRAQHLLMDSKLWDVFSGQTRVTKVTAHPNKAILVTADGAREIELK